MQVKTKTRVVVRVFFADTGEQKIQFASPFQKLAFKNIRVKTVKRYDTISERAFPYQTDFASLARQIAEFMASAGSDAVGKVVVER